MADEILSKKSVEAGFALPLRGAALAIILALALGLRLWGATFGLPFLYHPDEGAVVMPALNIVQTGNYRPLRLDYGSAYIYSLSAWYSLYFVYGAWRGYFETVADLPVYPDYWLVGLYPFPVIFLVGRLWTALLGSATALAVYALGRRLGGTRAGLAAAFLLAVLPLHVGHSHFATTDAPMTFVVTVASLRILDLFEQGRWRDYGWAGFWVGLAASTKFPGGVALGGLALAHLVRARNWNELFNPRLGLALAAAVGGFLLGTPYALDLPYFLNWLAVNLSFYGHPPAGVIAQSALRFYLQHFVFDASAPVVALGLGGIVWLTLADRPRGLILSAFPILHLMLITAQGARFPRMLVPLTPFLAVGAGVCLERLASGLANRAPAFRFRVASLIGLTALAVMAPLVQTIQADMLLATPDVRTEAYEWFVANVSPEAKIAADPMGPPLQPWPQLYLSWNLAEHDPDWYRAEGYNYFVLSEAILLDSNLAPEQAEAYQALRGGFTLLEIFRGPMLGTAGLRIWVYQVTP